MLRLSNSGSRRISVRWPLILALSLLICFAAELFLKLRADDRIEEWGRIGFGVVAACLLFFLSSYRLRKLVFTLMVGSMEAWRQSHLYFGILCVALILMHTNFRVHGFFGMLLVSLFILVSLSGMIGEMLYRTVPVWLSKQGTDAMELDTKRKPAYEYLTQADEIADKTPAEFKAFYGTRIRRLFASKLAPAKYLFLTEQEVIGRRRKLFASFYAESPPAGAMAIKNLEDLYTERDQMEYKFARLMTLRWWGLVHEPATAALITALLIHLWSIAYY